MHSFTHDVNSTNNFTHLQSSLLLLSSPSYQSHGLGTVGISKRPLESDSCFSDPSPLQSLGSFSVALIPLIVFIGSVQSVGDCRRDLLPSICPCTTRYIETSFLEICRESLGHEIVRLTKTFL